MAERLRIGADLRQAFEEIQGQFPTEAEPVILIAWYLHELAKEHGLSEHRDIDNPASDRISLPTEAAAIISQYLIPGGGILDDDELRERLYSVFVELADDPNSREQVNRHGVLTSKDFLEVAQVFWNIEGNTARPWLPIRAREQVTTESGRTDVFDIKVPGQMRDFASIRASDRAKIGVRVGRSGTTKGGSFRKQGARIAVLAASRLIDVSPLHNQVIEGVTVVGEEKSRGNTEWSLVWQIGNIETSSGLGEVSDLSDTPPVDHPAQSVYSSVVGRRPRVFVDQGYSPVGPRYVQREHDRELDRVWSGEDNRTVWLGGGPGLGKSFSARRAMETSLAHQDNDSEELLIWVESADAASVIRALSAAVDEMPHLRIGDRRQEFESPSTLRDVVWDLSDSRLPGVRELLSSFEPRDEITEHADSVSQSVIARPVRPESRPDPKPENEADNSLHKAKALLQLLRNCAWRWFLVFDNADADELIEQDLIPTGSNPNGRVLITTQYLSHQLKDYGEVIDIGVFDTDEADAFLETRIPGMVEQDRSALISVTGGLPLALSIAASTIVVNAMEPLEWISEFEAAKYMDEAADETDTGGYPHSLGRAWSVALVRAAEGLPEGIVERAAMVSAIQSPDGYPTWLWGSQALVRWVGGGEVVENQRGTPLVVKRLIEHGVVELQGPSWKRGVVTMHQLACRAIRESRPPEEVLELASIVARAWLQRLTETDLSMPTGLRENVRALNDALGQIAPDDGIPIEVEALHEYSLPESTHNASFGLSSSDPEEWLEFLIELVEICLPLRPLLAPSTRMRYLASLSAEIAQDQREASQDLTDRKYLDLAIEMYQEVISDPESTFAERAEASADLGKLQQDFGDADGAVGNYRASVDLWKLLIENDTTSDADRAKALVNRANLLDILGRDLEAHANRRRAAKLYRNLAFSDPSADELFNYLEALRVLYQVLATPQEWKSTLVQLRGPLLHAAESEMPSETGVGQKSLFEALAQFQRDIGATADAIQSLERVVAFHETMSPRDAQRLIKDIVALHVSLREWGDAESNLARLADPSNGSLDPGDQVLTASLAIQQGHFPRARDILRSAVSAYQARDLEEDSHLEGAHSSMNSRQDESFALADLRLQVMWLHEESLDRTAAAEAIQERKADLSEAYLTSISSDDLDQQRERALILSRLASARYLSGSKAQAHESAEQAIVAFSVLLELDPEDHEIRKSLDNMHRVRVLGLSAAEKHQASARALDEWVEFCRENATRDIDDSAAQKSLASVLTFLGARQSQEGETAGAQKSYVGAINILKMLTDLNPSDLNALSDLASAHGLLAELLDKQRVEGYLEQWERRVAILDRLIEAEPTVLEHRIHHAGAVLKQVSALIKLRLLEQADECLIRGLSTISEFVSKSDDELLHIVELRSLLKSVWVSIADLGSNSTEKHTRLASAITDARMRVEFDPQNMRAQSNLAMMLAQRAEWSAADGLIEEAREALSGATNIGLMVAELADDGNSDLIVTRFLRHLPELLRSYRDLLSDLGEGRESELMEERAAEMERRFPPIETGEED